MYGIILLIVVIAFIIGGYFVAGEIGEFIDKNYKGFDYDDRNGEDTTSQNEEKPD